MLQLVWGWWTFQTKSLYLGRCLMGLLKASLRNGSARTFETSIWRTPGFPDWMSFVRAGPTSSGLDTLTPSAPITLETSAKSGLAKLVPTYRSLQAVKFSEHEIRLEWGHFKEQNLWCSPTCRSRLGSFFQLPIARCWIRQLWLGCFPSRMSSLPPYSYPTHRRQRKRSRDGQGKPA